MSAAVAAERIAAAAVQSHHGPSVHQVRRQCWEALEACRPATGSSVPSYFKEVESRIFDLAGRPTTYAHLMTAYYRKFLPLYYNLRLYASELMSRYTPSELVVLTEVELNPQVREARLYQAEQHRLYQQILTQGVTVEEDDEEQDTTSTEHTTRCGKCHNTQNISINLRQLRGADEPMSVFYTCNQCGHHWRVG